MNIHSWRLKIFYYLLIAVSLFIILHTFNNAADITEVAPNEILVSNNTVCEKLPSYLSRFEPTNLVIQNRKKLLVLLQLFHQFSTKYNIPYQLTDATQLGAIRHHNLIPWDDDVDISIPYSYYNLTKNLLNHLIANNFHELSFNLTLNITHRYWLHGILKLYYSGYDSVVPSNPENRAYITWKWPFLDIFYPSVYYAKTDPIEWSIQYPQYSKEQPQTFFNLDDFYRIRYVFFYHQNIDYANKLIFKVHYKIRHHEQWRLNETVANEFDHINEYKKLHHFNKTGETIENMKKYFDFVEYKYINKSVEIETLKECNSDIILQTVVYKRLPLH